MEQATEAPVVDGQPSGSALAISDDGRIPPRPQVPGRIRSRTEALWKETNNVPDFDRAVAAWRECQKSMYPAWFDRTDVFRGLQPQELNTRENDRKVRVNYAYRGILQAVAMLVPDDHDFEWEPIPQVGEDTNAPNPVLLRFCETIKAETKAHLGEIRWQDILKGYAQDSLAFRIACLKITYDTAFIGSPISSLPDDKDQQHNVQRLRVLVEDYARRVFTQQDGRFEEMLELKDSLGVEGELESWAGIKVENIPLDCVRFSSLVRDIDRIHMAPWISHDVLMSGDDLRAKFPYSLNEDGITWEGIHPDDILRLTQGQGGAQNKIFGDTFWTTQAMAGAGTSAQASPQSEAQIRRYLVREVWNRSDGVVQVLVEGLEYPAAKWTPTKGGSDWYPFRFFRFNRVQGTPYGISDVELVRDIQNRVNRKKSDGEKARWLSIPRYIYDTTNVDETEAVKIKNINPGEAQGLNLQGKDPKDAFLPLSFEMKMEAFDVTEDQQDMRQMMAQPEQVQGVTGRANFSSEVTASMEGMQAAFQSRSNDFRREMEATYHQIAEMLVQVLTPEEVKEDCGSNALFPRIYSQAAGKKLHDQIRAQATAQITAQEQTAAMQAQAVGQPPPPANPDGRDSAIETLVEQLCMEAFGFPEPLTREVLFKRLRCKVTVGINVQADQAAAAKSLLMLFQAIQAGGMAAQAAGLTFDPTPILKMWGKPEWATIFKANPAQLGEKFAQAAQANPGAVPPELALQVTQLLAPLAQQAVLQAQAAAQPGNPAQPAAGDQAPPAAQPGQG